MSNVICFAVGTFFGLLIAALMKQARGNWR